MKGLVQCDLVTLHLAMTQAVSVIKKKNQGSSHLASCTRLNLSVTEAKEI